MTNLDRAEVFKALLTVRLDAYKAASTTIKQQGVDTFNRLLEAAETSGKSIEDEVTEWYWDQPPTTPLGVCNTVLLCYATYRQVKT